MGAQGVPPGVPRGPQNDHKIGSVRVLKQACVTRGPLEASREPPDPKMEPKWSPKWSQIEQNWFKKNPREKLLNCSEKAEVSRGSLT